MVTRWAADDECALYVPAVAVIVLATARDSTTPHLQEFFVCRRMSLQHQQQVRSGASPTCCLEQLDRPASLQC